MPGVLTGPHPGEEGGIFLLRSASATGTALVRGVFTNVYAGTADLRACTPSALITLETNAGTATATLLGVTTVDGWPSVAITSMVGTGSGVITALLTSLVQPFLVARVDARAAGTTANMHLAAHLV